jgi:UDP-GlcNAc:undecaprenyl-phosphate/decaprenyl-phosphate GlcNAc-1-phosphate transferase
MTGAQLLAACGGVLAGAVVSAAAIRLRLKTPATPGLTRINVNGRNVPVILGGPVALGGIVGLVVALALLVPSNENMPFRLAAALCVVIGLLWLAGSWDDRRGDERDRGFAGHLAAARGFRLTGGIVKLLAGVVAGVAVGFIVAHGWVVVEVALLVALGANTINLLDRAPGRAGKVALVAMILLAPWGAAAWAVAAAGSFGALGAALPADLKERAMLGDAGANPAGAIVGLGLGVSLPEGWRLVAIVILLALNLASERWSFSQAISRVSVLRAFDKIGRR